MTSGINFLLVEENSNLFNIEKYFSNFLGPNVKKADKNSIEIDEDLEKYFSSSLGALRIIKDGWETEAIPEIGRKANEKIGFFAKIFGIHS